MRNMDGSREGLSKFLQWLVILFEVFFVTSGYALQ
jgi:hypothetical protein